MSPFLAVSERIIILGAGRLGCALALALRAAQQQVVALWNRDKERGERAAVGLGQQVATGSLATLPLAQASLVIVAVADDAIADVGTQLAQRPLAPGTLVCHTAGVYGSEVLAPHSPRASLHPLCACADPQSGAAALRQAAFVVEGEAPAVERLKALVKALGGRPLALHGDKARYHAACVLASNLIVALFEDAVTAATGLEDARQVLGTLAAQALEGARQHGGRALTGPISRGDAGTLARHLAALPPAALDAYCALSLRAVQVAEKQGLDAPTAAKLRALLSAARATPRTSP